MGRCSLALRSLIRFTSTEVALIRLFLFQKMKRQSKKLGKQQTEAVADALANFFFEFWQNQNIKGNQVAVASLGSTLRGGSPKTSAAS